MSIEEIILLLQRSMAESYILDITPRPAPRPIRSRGVIRMPSWYKDYKGNVIDALREEGVRGGPDVFGLIIQSFFKYPKSTKPSGLVEGQFTSINKDLDNLSKGVLDALQDGRFIGNDKQIAFLISAKMRTIQSPHIQLITLRS